MQPVCIPQHGCAQPWYPEPPAATSSSRGSTAKLSTPEKGDKSKAKALGADGAAPHPAQGTGRTWWKFRIPDGSFGWVFLGLFFFSLSHFQGNKTRCHLLVAMAISPDSASAAEEEKSWESAVLPQSPEPLRAVGRAWINGALSDPGNGPIHGIQGRSCGFLRAQVGPSLNCFGARQMCRTSGDVAMVCLEGGFGCWGSSAHLWLHPEDRAGLRIAPHPTSQHCPAPGSS